MSFDIYKISNFELVRLSCNMLSDILLSLITDILSCQCKRISDSFKLKDTFSISLVSDLGKGTWSEESEGLCQKGERMDFL